ncbi:hypothetical protein FRB93_013124 [Tulasnella sp. JGI-2019a]|nr:hypothetical protein FRB93_013124 [Tulasnella sp. JGI-2019a]
MYTVPPHPSLAFHYPLLVTNSQSHPQRTPIFLPPSPMTSRTKTCTSDICAVLSTYGDRLSYHWSLLIPISNTEGETYHVTEDAVPTYQRQRQSLADPCSLVFVKIGQLSTSGMSTSDVDAALRRVSTSFPPSGLLSRAWFRYAVIDLQECGFIDFSDIDQLMDELLTLAMVVQQKGIRGAHFVSMVSK